MEDIDITATVDQDDDESSGDYQEEEAGISFDDIVSFAMLVETSVLLIAIIIFVMFFVF